MTSTETDTVVLAPGDDVQRALDTSPDGSVVELAEGEFRGPLWIRRSNVTLRGAGSGGTRVVPGDGLVAVVPGLHDAAEGSASGIVLHGDSVSSVVVEGLTVASFSGAGVYVHTVDGVRITDVHSVDNAVWGIYVRESTRIDIRNCVGSGAQYGGVALSFCPTADATVTDCHCSANAFGVMIDNSSAVTVERCMATGNAVGILLLNQVYEGEPDGGVRDCLVTGCTCVSNTLSAGVTSDGLGAAGPPISGVGIAIVGTERVTIVGNTIENNEPSGPSVMEGALSVSSSAKWGGSDPSGNRLLWNRLTNNTPRNFHGDDTIEGQLFENNSVDGVRLGRDHKVDL